MASSQRLAGYKILVTGASGFLGSHLCRRLAENDAEVHAVSRSVRTAQTTSLHWWQGDVADITTVRRLFGAVQPEVVFHLSGLVTASPGLDLVLATLHSLFVSTVNVLTVASELDCRRIVLAASLNEPTPDPTAPGHLDVTPGSPYAAAKWASSAYGRMFHKLYKTPVVIVRPFMTYGPRQDSSKLIPYVTLSLLQGEAPKLSSGQWKADWIYIDDVINGLLAAAQVPDIEGCTIDLGSGVLTSVQGIVHHILNLTGSKVTPLFGDLPDRPFEQVRIADTRYAFTKLGWKPAYPLEEGLKQTVAWYGQQIGPTGR